jgi:hypothetical protein
MASGDFSQSFLGDIALEPAGPPGYRKKELPSEQFLH